MVKGGAEEADGRFEEHLRVTPVLTVTQVRMTSVDKEAQIAAAMSCGHRLGSRDACNFTSRIERDRYMGIEKLTRGLTISPQLDP